MNAKQPTNKPRSTLPSPGTLQPADTKRPSARAPRANAAASATRVMPKRKKRFTL